ncbi:S41 family peptidase [Actinomadura sp. ATCC 31491]|uniref:S41 family peptidase n=1 Tax=Actinomadura luzonensis TaxID=2805427 RepID=A0ABT0FU37_9ACTN|nr:S41 family peptidase [Actinomadura luzonensis]MCK2215852.1 S41 family peptidase [Actinomadura luzonensis]
MTEDSGAGKRLADAVELRDFLRRAGTLTLADRRTLVGQAQVLIEQNYVHLPLKVAMHAVNPVQRLRLLALRLARQSDQTMDPEWRFHAELSQIFLSLRDLHTNYLLPEPFAGRIAYLPYQIEEYYEGDERHYVVARVVAGFAAPGFGPGVEVTHWNGVPIDRAVDLSALRFAGSNPAAAHARGLESLTIRPLRIHVPPDEDWVVLGHVGADGIARELRERWRVVENLPPFVNADELTAAAVAQGLDLATDEIGRAVKLLYVPEAITAAESTDAADLTADLTAGQSAEPDGPAGAVATSMPAVFRARSVTTASGTFGHLRVFTFNVQDPDGFVREFVRLIGLLPQDGLVVDVRGNGGGHIYASEFTLQTLTPRPITPEPTQFITTPLNTRICAQHGQDPTGQIDLGPWCASMNQALETGSVYSGGFPITPAGGANALGQQYHGPVVLVTDARCYSATDIFAAGFQDHKIGPVLGVADNTGAGGANVWTHALLKLLLEVPEPAPGTPYQELPGGANMRVAIRRSVRVHDLAGTPVEDLGVAPDERHRMTRRDVLEDNADLLEHAGRLLAALPARRLEVEAGAGELTLRTHLLDRADVYLDGRPRASADLTQEIVTVSVPGAGEAHVIRVEGFQDGVLAAARTIVR